MGLNAQQMGRIVARVWPAQGTATFALLDAGRLHEALPPIDDRFVKILLVNSKRKAFTLDI